MNPLRSLYCRLTKHRETRMGKRDIANPLIQIPLRQMMQSGGTPMICRRCGAVRLAAQRKVRAGA